MEVNADEALVERLCPAGVDVACRVRAVETFHECFSAKVSRKSTGNSVSAKSFGRIFQSTDLRLSAVAYSVQRV
jgi:hypothetical protein